MEISVENRLNIQTKYHKYGMPINPYIYESKVPPILYDDSTIFWFNYDDSEITLDSSGYVSSWIDVRNNGRYLSQPDVIRRPKLESDGVFFNGLREYIVSDSVTLNQPEMVYLVVKKYDKKGGVYFDGKSSFGSMLLYNHASTALPNQDNNMAMFAGTQQGDGGFLNITPYKFCLVKCLFHNSGVSFMDIDGVRKNANPIGNINAGGLVLGSNPGSPEEWASKITVKCIIVRNTVDSIENEFEITKYLNEKYKIS